MDDTFEPDNMPTGFEPKEAAVLNEECDQLQLAWAHFHDVIENTAEGNFHHPPAIFAMTIDMATDVIRHITGVHTHNEEGAINMAMRIAEFGGTMYRFGQHCANRGLYANNMEQCRCHQPTDAELAELFEDGK